jgi:RNA polymerase sigma-70 factor (ECF subfamily)
LNQLTTSVAQPEMNSGGAIEPEDLVRRALSGCADAFQQLIALYAPRLLVLLTLRHNGNRADAEDVVQEAALRAFQCWHQYNPRYPFRVWFFTIAYRLSTDALRRAKRDSQRHQRLWQRAAAPVLPPCPVEQNETIEHIWRIAEKELGEYYFSVLWLSLGEELTNREVATVLGKNILSIRVALHRAKKMLADRLTNLHQKSTDVDSSNR